MLFYFVSIILLAGAFACTVSEGGPILCAAGLFAVAGAITRVSM